MNESGFRLALKVHKIVVPTAPSNKM